jgi:CRISPR system Cascade subunit CasA
MTSSLEGKGDVMASFNLIDSPFVPCVVGGRIELWPLRSTLVRAHEVDELRDPSPMVTLALHRLLLAILHRTLNGPDSPEQWKKWWDKKCFDPDPINGYLSEVAVTEHFDLFDARRPFFQDVVFEAKTRGGINQIVRELSRGNNATLFDHTHEGPPPKLEAPAVARALITEQLFALGGGKSELGYTSSAPAVGGVLILIRGENLFETLLLNLMPPDVAGFQAEAPNDRPAWERPKRPSADSHTPDGYLDYLTWQSRSHSVARRHRWDRSVHLLRSGPQIRSGRSGVRSDGGVYP